MMITMGVCKVVLFYTCVVVFFGGSHGGKGCHNDSTGKSAAVRLSNDLFCNLFIRPVVNQSTKITVKTDFHILNVHMNEKWNILQTSIYLIMEWKDEFLVWDPLKYDNINTVYENSDNVWIPDIISYDPGFNGDDKRDFSYFLPSSTLKINSTGIVKYSHIVNLNAECSTDIAKWPFDSHNCSFFIGSPIYNNSYLNYSFTNGYYNMDYYKPGKEWKVGAVDQNCVYVSLSNGNDNSSLHCILQYHINVIRFSSVYFSSIVVPAVVLSLMRTSTFLMGRETTFRIILLCLIFISELLYIQFLDTKLPNNGNHVVYIIELYRDSLILTEIALFISVISNGLYKHGAGDFPRSVPEWLKSALKFILNKRPIAMLTNFHNRDAELSIGINVEEETPNTQQRDENALFWKTLSILVDCLSFLIILIISMINFWFLIP